MNTRRAWITLVAALLAAVTLVGAAYCLAKHTCVQQMARSQDDLEWLRSEFHLSPGEMAKIRQLHQGYLPKCQEMCERIAAKKAELKAALDGQMSVSPQAESALAELGALRAQCQTQMLRHFVEVSQAMPADQGKRYLAEMQRLTLGFHEQLENTMDPPSPHGHHEH